MVKVKKERTTLPPGVATLIRYEEKDIGIKIKPQQVIVLTAVIILVEIFLRLLIKV